MALDHEEVIKHFPPQFVIGKSESQTEIEEMAFDNGKIQIKVYEVSCEYSYSNPTGRFNLSLPHKTERKTYNELLSY